MTYTDSAIWLIIALVALGTFAIRYSFLGLIGSRTLPGWLLRLLRFTPVAVIPGLVAPLILKPGEPLDLVLIGTIAATLAAGWKTKNLLVAVVVGAATYAAFRYLSSS